MAKAVVGFTVGRGNLSPLLEHIFDLGIQEISVKKAKIKRFCFYISLPEPTKIDLPQIRRYVGSIVSAEEIDLSG